jgi:DNA-binding NarL/FixJ family response regulator
MYVHNGLTTDTGPVAVPTDTEPGATEWPLVGRDGELGSIHRSLGGGRGGVVLVGGPGVGKTRLVREALRQAEQHGHATEKLIPLRSGEPVPFAAFGHLLPGTRAPSNPHQVLGRLTRSLGVRPGDRRIVLGVDDAHLLDDASAGLLLQLTGTGNVFVVASVRHGEPMSAAVTALWKEGHCERLDVRALNRTDVETLTASVLGEPVSIPTSEFLWNATHGNVLFLREVVTAGLEGGAFTYTGRTWSWQGPLRVSMRLADVVESSLGRLDNDERAVLEVLAQGEPLEARILEYWFPAETLHAVERRGLLTSRRDGSRLAMQLANPLYGHVLRSRTPVLQARAIWRDLGEALLRTGARRSADALRVAIWRLDSGGTVPPELMVRAARYALTVFDPGLAERMARAVRAEGEHPAAALTLAQALHLQDRDDEALAVLDRMPDAPAACVDERAWAAALRAQALCWGYGRVAEAQAVLAEAEQTVPAGELRDLLAAVRAAVHLFAGQLGPALAAATGVLDRPDAHQGARVPTALTAAFTMAATGRAVAEAAHESPGWIDGPVPLALGSLVTAQYLVFRIAGRLDEAVQRSEQAYRTTLAQGDRRSASAWAMVLGRAVLDSGRAGEARRWLHEALTLARDSAHTRCLPACLSWLAEAEALVGDTAGAAASIERASALCTPATVLFDTDLALARAWLAGVQGELSAAIALASGAATRAESSGHLTAAVVALHTIVRLGGGASVVDRLQDLATAVDGPLAQTCAAHAVAQATQDGPGLDETAVAFKRVGALLLAAEAAAEAATVHYAKGRRGRSQSSSAMASSLRGDCGRVRSPALVGLKAPELTRRERQIAMLAAQGLSSRVIAQRLALSVRTVDNHLQVAYGKLGISGRRALPRALDITAA